MELQSPDARAGRKIGVRRFTDAEKCARWRARNPDRAPAYRQRPAAKAAHRAGQAAWQQENPQATAKTYRKWYAGRDPAARLLHNAKRSYEASAGKNPRLADRAGLASVDRVDNTKGYISGNVRVISWRANQLKSDGTAAEHEAVARYIREHANGDR